MSTMTLSEYLEPRVLANNKLVPWANAFIEREGIISDGKCWQLFAIGYRWMCGASLDELLHQVYNEWNDPKHTWQHYEEEEIGEDAKTYFVDSVCWVFPGAAIN